MLLGEETSISCEDNSEEITHNLKKLRPTGDGVSYLPDAEQFPV